MVLTPEMRNIGITLRFLKPLRRSHAPIAGWSLLFQSRAIACKGCPKSSYGCELARCLRCDNEFPLQGPLVKDREKQKLLANYMNNIVANYNKTTGKKGTR